MGTIDYYSVSPTVAATLRGQKQFWIWSDDQATWNAAPKATDRTWPFVVIAVRNGQALKGGAKLATVNASDDKNPPPPPLRDPGELESAYRARFQVETPKGFVG
jgi:hypothetical protein